MFNKTIIQHESKVVAVTKEIEKTITPDKVTEMYDKVREEVEKNLIQKVEVQSNYLNGVIMEIGHEYHTGMKKIYTRFSLNGKDYIESSLEEGQEISSKEELFNKLQEHYSKVVSNQVLKDIAPKIIKV